uniref:Uncharacterized protein n=1 Tax=Zea mays TaxID=4577 RepID=A0A804Q6G6_MAIZE
MEENIPHPREAQGPTVAQPAPAVVTPRDDALAPVAQLLSSSGDDESSDDELEVDFEFPFVCRDSPAGTAAPADELFADGRIRAFYPVFGRGTAGCAAQEERVHGVHGAVAPHQRPRRGPQPQRRQGQVRLPRRRAQEGAQGQGACRHCPARGRRPPDGGGVPRQGRPTAAHVPAVPRGARGLLRQRERHQSEPPPSAVLTSCNDFGWITRRDEWRGVFCRPSVNAYADVAHMSGDAR